MHKALGLILRLHRPGVLVQTFNLGAWEVETGESKLQGHPQATQLVQSQPGCLRVTGGVMKGSIWLTHPDHSLLRKANEKLRQRPWRRVLLSGLLLLACSDCFRIASWTQDQLKAGPTSRGLGLPISPLGKWPYRACVQLDIIEAVSQVIFPPLGFYGLCRVNVKLSSILGYSRPLHKQNKAALRTTKIPIRVDDSKSRYGKHSCSIGKGQALIPTH